VIAHESQVHSVPDIVSLEDAAYAEPISCCLHGADLANIKPGDRVLITGGGTIGLLMLQICRHMGASFTAVSEPMGQKRTLALSLGADSVFDSSIIDADKLRKCNFNKVIECSGSIDAVRTAIDSCQATGTVMLFGLTKPDDEISVRPFDLFKRELTIKASYINPGTMTRALDLLALGKIKTAPLTGGTIALDELPRTLANSSETLKNGKIFVDFEIG
ncbi:MAG: zinc-binding dehydrogenase, partial [Clostridia bacterium]|nr:zinc-binding dehydrogenase [Clostridia bacterium]